MIYPDRALSVWFGRHRQNDLLYLHTWREAPLTYSPRQDITAGWNLDHYEVVLGVDHTGDLFRRAADLTLQNQFYPPDVMLVTADHQLEHRPIQPGDRVLQRIRVFWLGGWPLLEVLTLNEITEVVQEPRRVGFTYTTTSAHSEVGEWSPVVEWRDNDEVVLVIDVVSTTRTGVSKFGRRLARRLQLNAHKRSIQNFKAQLLGQRLAAPSRRAAFPVDLLPVFMLGTAFVLFIWAMWSFFGRSEE